MRQPTRGYYAVIFGFALLAISALIGFIVGAWLIVFWLAVKVLTVIGVL